MTIDELYINGQYIKGRYYQFFDDSYILLIDPTCLIRYELNKIRSLRFLWYYEDNNGNEQVSTPIIIQWDKTQSCYIVTQSGVLDTESKNKKYLNFIENEYRSLIVEQTCHNQNYVCTVLNYTIFDEPAVGKISIVGITKDYHTNSIILNFAIENYSNVKYNVTLPWIIINNNIYCQDETLREDIDAYTHDVGDSVTNLRKYYSTMVQPNSNILYAVEIGIQKQISLFSVNSINFGIGMHTHQEQVQQTLSHVFIELDQPLKCLVNYYLLYIYDGKDQVTIKEDYV